MNILGEEVWNNPKQILPPLYIYNHKQVCINENNIYEFSKLCWIFHKVLPILKNLKSKITHAQFD